MAAGERVHRKLSQTIYLLNQAPQGAFSIPRRRGRNTDGRPPKAGFTTTPRRGRLEPERWQRPRPGRPS
nr:MAG TPA: hypothetical protein [Caudoviricetes sp.]